MNLSVFKQVFRKFHYSFLFLSLVFSIVLIGQTENKAIPETAKLKVMEVPDNLYTPLNKNTQLTSPAYTYTKDGFFMTQVNINASGNNIIGDASNEPSIVFDPNDHNKMAIGWRHFETISNNFRQAGIAYTSDGGVTWSFDGVIDPGIFRSDPVLAADADGNFFYNSLTVQSNDYWCDVYKSEDGGESWDLGTFAEGGDKQWFSIDKSGGEGAGNIYHYWSSVSICPPYKFTRSLDNGLSYEDCSDVDGYWGTTAIGGDGALYVSGFHGYDFVVTKSSTAQYSLPMSWDFSTSVSLDGFIVGFGGYGCPNPSGLLGQTIISVDSSGGATDGYIYLLCSVERQSGNDPCDVMFARSTDGGLSWSAPQKINDDAGSSAYQWFGTLSVAPDGRIDVIWLDNRDNPGSLDSKLYYAASWDGGMSWSQNIPLGESFDPHVGWPQQDKMGDYFDMFSDESGAHLAWANTLNGEQDTYYAFIPPEITGINPQPQNQSFKLHQNVPNPFKAQTSISFTLDESMAVSLTVYDVAGREIASLVNENKLAGKHLVVFEAKNIQAGIYYYKLTAGKDTQTRKLMVLE